MALPVPKSGLAAMLKEGARVRLLMIEDAVNGTLLLYHLYAILATLIHALLSR